MLRLIVFGALVAGPAVDLFAGQHPVEFEGPRALHPVPLPQFDPTPCVDRLLVEAEYRRRIAGRWVTAANWALPVTMALALVDILSDGNRPAFGYASLVGSGFVAGGFWARHVRRNAERDIAELRQITSGGSLGDRVIVGSVSVSW